ncbi:MAG: hypothetical protein QM534_10550, partial [Sediminibacterium sp.]|nr:hypothetical protein [Sediminibacterium sp.]
MKKSFNIKNQTLRHFLIAFSFLLTKSIYSQCNASFTFTLGTNGQVNFSSNSTGVNNSTSYFWNFGNGNTAT